MRALDIHARFFVQFTQVSSIAAKFRFLFHEIGDIIYNVR